jgi:hypothetical protein
LVVGSKKHGLNQEEHQQSGADFRDCSKEEYQQGGADLEIAQKVVQIASCGRGSESATHK